MDFFPEVVFRVLLLFGSLACRVQRCLQMVEMNTPFWNVSHPPEGQLSVTRRHFIPHTLRAWQLLTPRFSAHVRKPELSQAGFVYRLKRITRVLSFSSWKSQKISYSTTSRAQAFEEVQPEAVLKPPFLAIIAIQRNT